jgi:glutamate synthase domain-containing protein 2
LFIVFAQYLDNFPEDLPMTLADFLVPRFAALWIAIIGLCLTIFLFFFSGISIFWIAFFAFFTVVGWHDLRQTSRAVLRNYPIMGHVRYLVEFIRPEIRQYLLEDDNEAVPYSRQNRSLIYARAKNQEDAMAFGTTKDVYAERYEWINHSINAVKIDGWDFRVTVGAQRAKPYSASILNISAMSFGALSGNAITALNLGAKKGGFAHDTGEGAISPYHRQGGDLIWEIGSGYFGCRTKEGKFDAEKFAINAQDPHVKMIEIKISQGAKPGSGGILPAAKVSAEIAATRGISMGEDCISPAIHSAFTTPLELVAFIEQLRNLSGGKPVGFKLCVGHPWEFFAICKAMLETGITPDFIVVDGSEGGTGAAPLEFADHIGMPLQQGLMIVHNALVGLGLRDKICIGASGKVSSAFEIAKYIALGADWCNAARAFMFALGCIQSRSCHTGRCPTGVATQDARRQRALVVDEKGERVKNYHNNTLKAFSRMLGSAGLYSPRELHPRHIVHRLNAYEAKQYSELFRVIRPGELLTNPDAHPLFRHHWALARSDSFAPNIENARRASD